MEKLITVSIFMLFINVALAQNASTGTSGVKKSITSPSATKISSTANNDPGSLRYNDGNFEGYNGNTWMPFAAGPANSIVLSFNADDPGLVAAGYAKFGSFTQNTETNIEAPKGNWTDINSTNAPAERSGHTAVWTGSKMIIWGGINPQNYTRLNSGAMYDPSTDTWTPVATAGAPSARSGHVAIWTGSKMIIWGGGSISGGIYDPSSNTWTQMSTTNAPIASNSETAIWTGTKMIVWGGDPYNNSGGIYDPSTNTWSPVSALNAPSGRMNHTAIWTGSKMIIWGGDEVRNMGNTNDGGIYDPSTNTWKALSLTNVPTRRSGHTAIWTGSKMIVWGGSDRSNVVTNTGGAFDPASNTWTSLSTLNAPGGRIGHSDIWQGSKMIIWAGSDGGSFYNDGGLYDPTTDSWATNSSIAGLVGRMGHAAIWTGSKMIVWGGLIGSEGLKDGGIFSLQGTVMYKATVPTTFYLYKKETNLRSAATIKDQSQTGNTPDSVSSQSKIFSDSFQQTKVGETSSKWRTNGIAKVTAVPGESGNWLQLKQTNTYIPILQKDLPVSFSLSFDVYFTQNTNLREDIQLRLLSVKDPADLYSDYFAQINFSGYNNFSIKNASGSIQSPRDMRDDSLKGRLSIHVTKQGQRLTVSCNNEKLFDVANFFEAGKLLNAIHWVGSIPPRNSIYITNVDISAIE